MVSSRRLVEVAERAPDDVVITELRWTDTYGVASATSLVHLLRARALTHATQIAFRFLEGDGELQGEVTFAELDARAARIAAGIRMRTVPGDRVMLLVPPGLEYIAAFFGCLYAGAIAVPAYPPNPRRADARVSAMIASCDPAIAIVSSAFSARLEGWLESAPHLASLCWLDVATLAATEGECRADVPADALAMLQYTSGSTAEPRGVRLTHANLLATLRANVDLTPHPVDTLAVFWLPPFHDMGLIGAILQTVYLACTCMLMAPTTFLQRPARWLEAISRWRATSSGAPNFAYDLCVDRVSDEELKTLDLSSWTVAYNGAEPIRSSTIDRFVARFGAAGFSRDTFLPCYGLAETALIVSGASFSERSTVRCDATALAEGRVAPVHAGGVTLVSSGTPAPELDVRIVDPGSGIPAAQNEIGEIWVAGPSVSGGYWRDEAATQSSFGARIAGVDASFVRTGDLGALVGDELLVTGRLKDVIILQGRNVYPHDIERIAESAYAAVRAGGTAAFGEGEEHESSITLVVEVGRHHTESENHALFLAVRTALAEQLGLVPQRLVVVRQGTIPRTSSGKVRRRATRHALAEGGLTTIGSPWISPEPRLVTRALADPEARDAGVMVAFLRDYAERALDTRAMDELRRIPESVRRDFAAEGLFGLQVPPALGGAGLSHAGAIKVVEQLASIDLSLATWIGGHNSLGVRPLLRHANHALRDELVPSLARGELLGALAITEPGAGSNPWALSSIAIPTEGGWRVSGQKQWIGSAEHAGVMSVFARVAGADGGLTAFALRAGTPGLHVGAESLTMGMRSMQQNSVQLDRVLATPGDLLGGVGEGMLVAQDTFLVARLGVAAMSLGAMKRALQLAHRYASRRPVATGMLADHPLTRARLTAMAGSAAALDTYLQWMAGALDRGVDLPEDAFIICKTAAPELLWTAVDDTLQLLGGRGYMETNPVASMLRDARLLRIFEGPTEPLLAHLGARALRDASVVRALLGVQLGALDLVDRVLEGADRAVSRLGDGLALGGRAPAQQWAAGLVGRAMTEAVMLASARRVGGAAGDAASLHFEARLVEALQRCAGASRAERLAMDSGSRLDDLVALVTADIGDVEQARMPADAMLRRSGGVRAASDELAVATPASDATVEGGTLAFVLGWVSEEFGVDPASLQAGSTLRELGLDSLAATRLVVALEERLQRRIDPTALWRAPTIGAFVAEVERAALSIVPDESAAMPAPPTLWPDDADINAWPEVLALGERLADAAADGIQNPYFHVHEGVSGATALIDGRELLNFANYNYVDLSGHAEVTAAAQAATERYGTSVSASRVASGERPLHRELERSIAEFVGVEDATVFVGGHATNVATISHLFGPGDLILCDALMHNSAVQGAAFSGARWLPFPHNDWQALDQMLGELRPRHRRAVIVIEGVYSADGDVPDLARFLEVKERHQCLLLVDEAHSLGVLGETGRGLGEHAGIDPTRVDLWMGTLSKSLASCGGYIASSAAVARYLRYTAPGFVFSVGITPPNAAAALAALAVLRREPERVQALRSNTAHFSALLRERGLDIGHSLHSGVIPVLIGDSNLALRVSQRLYEDGINVQPMVMPAVANDAARLRFFVSSAHSHSQLVTAADATARALREARAASARPRTT